MITLVCVGVCVCLIRRYHRSLQVSSSISCLVVRDNNIVISVLLFCSQLSQYGACQLYEDDFFMRQEQDSGKEVYRIHYQYTNDSPSDKMLLYKIPRILLSIVIVVEWDYLWMDIIHIRKERNAYHIQVFANPFININYLFKSIIINLHTPE